MRPKKIGEKLCEFIGSIFDEANLFSILCKLIMYGIMVLFLILLLFFCRFFLAFTFGPYF